MNNNIMEKNINQLSLTNSLTNSLSFTKRFPMNIYYNSILPINNRVPFRSMFPFRNHSVSWRKGNYMRQLIYFVKNHWHANIWDKTLLGREQDIELAIKWLTRYWCIVPRRWSPGVTMNYLTTPVWSPGFIMNYLTRPVSQLISPPMNYLIRLDRQSNPSPWLLSRVLADIKRFDLMNSDSLELMHNIAYVLGFFAFWEMAPLILLEVDPNLVLQPDILRILKRVILHQGCQPLEGLDPCTCLDVPLHREIAEDFQQMSSTLTAEARKEAGVSALAFTLGAVLLGLMLLNVDLPTPPNLPTTPPNIA